jgi:hypothetical protein
MRRIMHFRSLTPTRPEGFDPRAEYTVTCFWQRSDPSHLVDWSYTLVVVGSVVFSLRCRVTLDFSRPAQLTDYVSSKLQRPLPRRVSEPRILQPFLGVCEAS